MRASRIAALGLTLLLSAGLVACGGDDGGDEGAGSSEGVSAGVSAEAYAAEVCGAMQDWVAGIEDQMETLSESFTSSDPEAGRQALSDLLGEMSSQTGDLAAAVDDAGVPDVDGGEEAADSLVTAFEDVQGLLGDAQQDVEDLPSDPQAFAQGASELGTTLQEALSSVGGSIEEPDSPELQEAFKNEKSCSAIP